MVLLCVVSPFWLFVSHVLQDVESAASCECSKKNMTYLSTCLLEPQQADGSGPVSSSSFH